MREEARARERSSCLSRACGPRTRRPKPEEDLFRSLMCPQRQEKAAARCVGTSREASQIEKVSCASDARETSEPHVPLKRGDVGVAQGGGAEKDASGGPQERPGSGLSEKAPTRRAAPGVVSSEPFLREGEKGAPRRFSRLRKASAADIGEVGAASAGTRAVPPSRSDGRRARRRGAFEGGARVRAGRRVLCATR